MKQNNNYLIKILPIRCIIKYKISAKSLIDNEILQAHKLILKKYKELVAVATLIFS